jgi:hypothetical protein
MFTFARDKKKVEVQALVRRMADLTVPSLAPLGNESRVERRMNRCLPVLLVPYEQHRAVVDEATIALARDVSDHGVALILPQPYRAEDVIVGLWLTGPHVAPGPNELYLLHAQIRHCTEVGGGYWQLGLEWFELLKSRKLIDTLRPFALQLLPRVAQREPEAESLGQV